MKDNITIKLFISGECDTCLETKQLLLETEELSDKIKVEVLEVTDNVEEAKKYDITLTPTFVFLDSKGEYTGVRFSGFPGGHEINSYISALMSVSGLNPEISPQVLERIAKIDKPVDIKVLLP